MLTFYVYNLEFQVHKSITTLQGEDIVFLATDINLPGQWKTAVRPIFCVRYKMSGVYTA